MIINLIHTISRLHMYIHTCYHDFAIIFVAMGLEILSPLYMQTLQTIHANNTLIDMHTGIDSSSTMHRCRTAGWTNHWMLIAWHRHDRDQLRSHDSTTCKYGYCENFDMTPQRIKWHNKFHSKRIVKITLHDITQSEQVLALLMNTVIINKINNFLINRLFYKLSLVP